MEWCFLPVGAAGVSLDAFIGRWRRLADHQVLWGANREVYASLPAPGRATTSACNSPHPVQISQPAPVRRSELEAFSRQIDAQGAPTVDALIARTELIAPTPSSDPVTTAPSAFLIFGVIGGVLLAWPLALTQCGCFAVG
jgi:hypothetical protein